MGRWVAGHSGNAEQQAAPEVAGHALVCASEAYAAPVFSGLSENDRVCAARISALWLKLLFDGEAMEMDRAVSAIHQQRRAPAAIMAGQPKTD